VVHGNLARSPGPEIDDDGLPKRVTEPGANESDDKVARAARGVGNDEMQWACRVPNRVCECRPPEAPTRGCERDQPENPAARCLHVELPVVHGGVD
jgi:hypothetical protein